MRCPAIPFLLALLTTSAAIRADPAATPPPAKALDPSAPSETIYQGKSADGLVYFWRGPKQYDASKGIGLTVILHGSNLNHEWGFANHVKTTFRPDDLVVSPDGTTPNDKGGFNFMGAPKDAKRVHAFLEEVKKAFKIRSTCLYGHSQGSFFSIYYAGEYPDDVNGVVAQASGIWTQTRLGKPGHHQAIVLMHGTQDPVVPYAQSVSSFPALAKAGYPTIRLYSLEPAYRAVAGNRYSLGSGRGRDTTASGLRQHPGRHSLEWWNHWPAEENSGGGTHHTSQELAWAEGMGTKDADRLAACLDMLADVKDKVEQDWAGLYSLAKHVLVAPFAREGTKARATKAIGVIESLAKKHVESFAGVKPGAAADGKPWMAHLPVFLRQFVGVPACDELSAAWKDTLEKHKEKGIAHLKKYYASREKDVAGAFDEGVAAVSEGFLWCEVEDKAFREALEAWQKDATKFKLSKKALKDYAVVDGLIDAWKKGWDEYADACKTAGDT